VYEIDFLAVENEDGDSTKSGDAIAMHFDERVVVIDGGFSSIGDNLADHINTYYGSTHVDLLISTHPDTDHLNGLIKVLERCTVGELMMHLPWLHNSRANVIGNYEKIVEIYNLAISKGVTVTEPFTGESRFADQISILGPTKVYYEELLSEAVTEASAGKESLRASAGGFGTLLLSKATRVLERVVSFFPAETLNDLDETSPRNKMSVITLLQVDGKRMLFTGDAGIPSLEAAADWYEATVGAFSLSPLSLLQAPHHGSKRNVGPAILDRLLGAPGAHFSVVNAVVSSAKLSEKHPSPKVTNALGRRGANVNVTEGSTIAFTSGQRTGWAPKPTVGPLEESDD